MIHDGDHDQNQAGETLAKDGGELSALVADGLRFRALMAYAKTLPAGSTLLNAPPGDYEDIKRTMRAFGDFLKEQYNRRNL